MAFMILMFIWLQVFLNSEAYQWREVLFLLRVRLRHRYACTRELYTSGVVYVWKWRILMSDTECRIHEAWPNIRMYTREYDSVGFGDRIEMRHKSSQLTQVDFDVTATSWISTSTHYLDTTIMRARWNVKRGVVTKHQWRHGAIKQTSTGTVFLRVSALNVLRNYSDPIVTTKHRLFKLIAYLLYREIISCL